jgi:hypothetical protein
MRKLIVMLCVFVFLIVSFTPASALNKNKWWYITYVKEVERVVCVYIPPMDNLCFSISEDARITFPDIHGPASLEDL